MNNKWAAVALVISVISSVLVSGCTTAEMSLSQRAHIFKNKRIALIDTSPPPEDVSFDGLTLTWDTTDGEKMTSALERALMRLPLYKIQDRSRLKQVLDELDLQRTSLFDRNTAVKVGKMAGLDGIITVQPRGYFKLVLGVFMYIDKRVTVRLIDVETGAVVWSGEANFTDMCLILPPASVLYTSAETRMAKSIKDELRKELMW